MTKTERIAERAHRLKQELEAKGRQLAQVQSQQREAARKAQNHRRFQVGKLADDAGLCGWDDATLTGLFQSLALLRECSSPVAVLESLLVGCDEVLVVDMAGSALGLDDIRSDE